MNNISNQTPSSPQQKSYKQVFLQGIKNFECLVPNCQKIFRFKSDIERHLLSHSDQRPFPCPEPECKKSFKRIDALKSHLNSHNKTSSVTVTIPGCDAQFTKKPSVQPYQLPVQNQESSSEARARHQLSLYSFEPVSMPVKKLCPNQKESSSSPSQNKGSSSDSDSGFEDSEDEAEFLNLVRKVRSSQAENSLEQLLNNAKETIQFDTTGWAQYDLESSSCAQDFLESLCKKIAQENAGLKKEILTKIEKIALCSPSIEAENDSKFMSILEELEYRMKLEKQNKSGFEKFLL